jgi:hypothetical protein
MRDRGVNLTTHLHVVLIKNKWRYASAPSIWLRAVRVDDFTFLLISLIKKESKYKPGRLRVCAYFFIISKQWSVYDRSYQHHAISCHAKTIHPPNLFLQSDIFLRLSSKFWLFTGFSIETQDWISISPFQGKVRPVISSSILLPCQ